MMNLQNVGPPMPMIAPRGLSSQLQTDKFDLNSKLADKLDDKFDSKADLKRDAKNDIKVNSSIKRADVEKPKMPVQKNKSEAATQKFMDSMEDELSVSPERILVAMAAMKPQELAEPAAVNSETFVNNLNLEPAARSKAFQLYNQLLMDKGVLTPLEPGNMVAQFNVQPAALESAKSDLTGKIAPNLAGNQNAFVDSKAFVDPKAVIDESANLNGDGLIDTSMFNLETNEDAAPNENLNASSFQSAKVNPNANAKLNVNPNTKAQSLEANNTKSDYQGLAVGNDDNEEDSSDPNEVRNEMPLEPGQLEPERTTNTKSAKNIKGNLAQMPITSSERRQKLNASLDKMNESFFMNGRENKKILDQVTNPEGQNTILPFDRRMDQQRSLVDDVQSFKQNEALAVPGAIGFNGKGKSDTTANSDKGEFGSDFEQSNSEDSVLANQDSDFQNQVYGKLNSEWEASKPAGAKLETGGLDTRMSNADKVKNMQKLIENEKILTQNGGGEMQMKLTPEGLGEVQLKVVVANGKVDLEIKSQNHEIKKLFDSTINELKSSLAQHSLSIDKVKVDVGSQDSTSSNDSFLKQFQMNEGQEQARQFLGQFRENNFSQRNNMFDVPGFKTYQTQRGEDLEPVSNKPVRPKAHGGYKGQGLNLVA